MASAALLHPRNPHAGRYDFAALVKILPALAACIRPNPAGEDSIDFADPAAVLLLNQALLAHHYGIAFWLLPEGYLCPPIPGRADYVHYLADLLSGISGGVPRGKQIRLLDIGTGASCIYPIIASQSYGWHVTGTDIDPVALKAAQLIVKSNTKLKSCIDIVPQLNRNHIFHGVINAGQKFHLTLCNPPFYAGAEEAAAATKRKWQNLGKQQQGRNFAGQQHELWCSGGELAFVSRMIAESCSYASQVCWFSSLVSQGKHLGILRKRLHQAGAVQTEVLPMRQGQKISRILAWSFLSPEQQRQF